jgi:hypothetical protein
MGDPAGAESTANDRIIKEKDNRRGGKMSWKDQLKSDPFPWLLEEKDPGPRYLALRDLLDAPADSPELVDAKKKAHQNGPIAFVLKNMHADGYWEEEGPGYYPKYRSSVWSLILLAQLGAQIEMDKRIGKAVQYFLDKSLTPLGQISASGTAAGTMDCLQGNLCYALLDLGCRDERLDKTFEWMARSVTGEGIAPMTEKDAPVRYYAGKCEPLFACGANDKKSCAWGAAKVMLAFGKLPHGKRTPLIEEAIRQGVDYIFSVNPAQALWHSAYAPKPSGNWWKFGFPLFYITDLLQVAEAMVLLGYGQDKRMADTINLIRNKQDKQGRWPLEFSYADKTWVDFGAKKQPNKWVTIRALRVLKGVG